MTMFQPPMKLARRFLNWLRGGAVYWCHYDHAHATEAGRDWCERPSPHPVDVLKEQLAVAGWPPLPAENEAEMRAICDELVCPACGRAIVDDGAM